MNTLRLFVALAFACALTACATSPKKESPPKLSAPNPYEKQICEARLQKLCDVAHILLYSSWPPITETRLAEAFSAVAGSSTAAKKPFCPDRLLAVCTMAAAALDRWSYAPRKKEDPIETMIVGLFKELRLDKHTFYAPPGKQRYNKATSEADKKPQNPVDIARSYTGIGISRNDNDVVVRVYPDSPAQRIGIKRGDRITVRKDNGSATEFLWTKQCTMTTHQYRVLKKARIAVTTVSADLLPGGFGYIAIDQFGGGAGAKVNRSLKDLTEKNGGKRLRGLILDLRGNPGGTIASMLGVADSFFSPKTHMMSTAFPNETRFYTGAAARDALEEKPLVVLVDDNSKSASEAFAGAIQDYRRGIIVGVRTGGKGTVQTTRILSDHSLIHITRSYYTTPRGREVHKKGITPDVQVLECGTDMIFRKGFQVLKTLANRVLATKPLENATK